MNRLSKISSILKNIAIRRNNFSINKQLLKKYLPPDPVIVEAGAHIGIDTIELACVFPKGKIYAFEPVSHIYEKLLNNTKSYNNIHCQKLALGDQNKMGEIFISSGLSDGSSSLLLPKDHLIYHPEVNFEIKEAVIISTLDSWCDDHGIHKVDLLWLDLQGMELSVLKSSPKILKTVKALFTEVNIVPLYENSNLYPEYREWLINQNFKIEAEFIFWQDAGNVLFIK
jgi:FkbM family methyltransferase